MKKSDFATGQYINVFHPYDSKYFDVFFILDECCCPKDKSFCDKLLDIVQPIVEKAYNERKTKEELYDILRDKFYELSTEKPIENFEFDEFFGYQIVIHHWSVIK